MRFSKPTHSGALLGFFALLFSGCLPSAKITRRYTSARMSPAISHPEAVAPTLSVFVLTPPPESSKITLKDLSDRGQSALIRELAKLSSTARELNSSLGLPIQAAVSPQGVIDERKKKRRVVFSVINNMRLPGNRLHRTTTVLSELSNGRFTNWNQFTTEYGSVDLGSLGSDQNRSLTASIKADPRGPLFGEQSLTASASGKLTEALVMRERYLKISGILQAGSATLHQQGVPGIDLAGNSSVDLDIEVIGTRTFAMPAYLVGGTEAQPTITRVTRVFPSPAAAVTAQVSICAELRAITRGSRTPHEGDDSATYLSMGCIAGGAVELASGPAPTPTAVPPKTTPPSSAAGASPAQADKSSPLKQNVSRQDPVKTPEPPETTAKAEADKNKESKSNPEPALDAKAWLERKLDTSVTLVSEEDARVTGWQLRGSEGVVHIKDPGEDHILMFVTRDDAMKALASLLAARTRDSDSVLFGGRRLVFKIKEGDKELIGKDLGQLVIETQPLNYQVNPLVPPRGTQ
jgi:hypothetical protein